MRSKAHKQEIDWDAVVVGAGPAGAAAAITMSRSGLRVLLLEKQSNPSVSLGESLPPSAIGMVEHFLGSIENALIDLGVHKTSGNISCWDSSSADISDFFFTSKGYGLCVDRRYFDEALRQVALKTGVTLKLGTKVNACEREGNHWKLEVCSGTSKSEYTTRFILDCTGRRSAIAKMLGIKRWFDDKLFAFALRFVSTASDERAFYTHIEASQYGWWYCNRLPLVSQFCKDKPGIYQLVAFLTDKDTDAAKQALNADNFMTLLEQQSKHLYGYLKQNQYQAVGRLRGAAAGSERLHEFCGDGWLAVGDAAQAYDPLSSQGIDKALRSASLAGQMVIYSLKNRDATHTKPCPFLRRYAREQTQLWERYVQQRNYYYAGQPRWPTQQFWSRRQQPTTHAVSHK